ncbi:MAG: ATP-binding cassette domain-containing protein [Mediterranea sp.]|jgi:ATPase subunit of ABC transporter with duplicated ATPase domains|nr:ATP-binding cassette domain-containing protein [Mediterranea sp.]
MSIVISDVSYHYSYQQALLEHISFSVSSNGKVSIIGNNGTGKSTLLRLLAGELMPSSGAIQCSSQPYYIPQQIGITGQSISEALGIDEKINALHAINNGSGDYVYYDLLEDDWDIESRCRSALDFWGLVDIGLASPIDSLSGGEKSKIFLAGLLIHKPDIILLDEPTNHLDHTSRGKLYDYIVNCKATIVVVSHDITLLNLLNTTYELTEKGIRVYGGNYFFYKEQKEIEEQALAHLINSEEASLRLARKNAQKVRERQDRRTSQGERNKQKGGVARIVINARGNLAENSSAKLKEKHIAIIDGSQQKLTDLRQKQQVNSELKIDFKNTQLHKGKLLVEAVNVNFEYADTKLIWETPLNIEVRSGERIHITGNNGAGKTTLIKLLTGKLHPAKGTIKSADFSYIYLDQQYSEVDKDVTVLELAHEYNFNNLQEHEIRLRLNRALFPQKTWDKNCQTLSGGESMRLYLCCLMISNHIPDMFILDEPTNNLDISSLSIITNTIKNYQGTILVISHDKYFVDEIGITKSIEVKIRNNSIW